MLYGIILHEIKFSFLIKKMSFEVKHCKIETVVLFKSAQAVKWKLTFSCNAKTAGIGQQLLERGQEC